jgi:hypothetical protein
MYNLAVLFNSDIPQPIYLSPEFLSGIFINYYFYIKNRGLNLDSIISNPNIRHEIRTNIENIYYRKILSNIYNDSNDYFTDGINDFLKNPKVYFDKEINRKILSNIYNDYITEGIDDFLKNPKVYIDTIVENKSQFDIWMYNYMNSKIERIIEKLYISPIKIKTVLDYKWIIAYDVDYNTELYESDESDEVLN